MARQQRTLGVKLAHQEGLLIRFRPAFIVAEAEIAGHFGDRFSMARALLTQIDAHQRHAEALHAAQRIQQLTIGDNAHVALLQRLIDSVKRRPELIVGDQQIGGTRQTLALQAALKVSLRI